MTDRETNKHAVRQTVRQIGRWAVAIQQKQSDRWLDRQIDRHAGRVVTQRTQSQAFKAIARQTDRLTDRQSSYIKYTEPGRQIDQENWYN